MTKALSYLSIQDRSGMVHATTPNTYGQDSLGSAYCDARTIVVRRNGHGDPVEAKLSKVTCPRCAKRLRASTLR